MSRAKKDQTVARREANSPGQARSICFVCPSCFIRYEFRNPRLRKLAPICHYCGVPLIRRKGVGR